MAEVCYCCGEIYETVYQVPDEVWIIITGRTDGGGLLCPKCADQIARMRGINLYWTANPNEYQKENKMKHEIELKIDGATRFRSEINSKADKQNITCWEFIDGLREGSWGSMADAPAKCCECASFIQSPGGDGYCLNHQIPVAGYSRAPNCYKYWQSDK